MLGSKKDKKTLTNAEIRMVKYFRVRPDRAAEILLRVDFLPFQRLLVLIAWYFPFALNILTRGAGKTFMLAVLALLRAILYSNQKVGLLAASYRQSKMIFAEMERIYMKSPILRAMTVKPPVRGTDLCYFNLKNGSEIQALPLGDGEKIRGARFYYIVLDELAQIPEAILNIVVIGMTATKQDPIKNARLTELKKRLKKEGKVISRSIELVSELTKNYIIGCSTAFYQFNHLFQMLKNYIRIIKDHVKADNDLDLWKLYSVYKLSYHMIPEGFMSIESIMMAKEKMSSLEFKMEYECLFPADSGGFYPAQVVLNAYVHDKKIHFELSGNPEAAYVLFIDPARTSDNCTFAINKILSTTDVTRFACVGVEAIRGRKFQEAAARIRDICRRFNVVRISMDRGGGGLAIKDLLNDPDKCPEGEELIWDYEDPASYLDEEMKFRKPGKYILHLVTFNPAYLTEANHGLLSSLERKEYVFPTPLGPEDLMNKTQAEADELEDMETEMMSAKNEIINIVMTSTPKGSPHWDTPSKGQRKDRYTAILGGCKECKDFIRPEVNEDAGIDLPAGGWAGKISSKDPRELAVLAGDISESGIKVQIAQARGKNVLRAKKISDIAKLS